MRKEVKNYYEANFGSFEKLTAMELKTLSACESWLLDLPGVLFFESSTKDATEFITRQYLHAKIKRAFIDTQN